MADKKRILVIDDDTAFVGLVATALAEDGYDVAKAYNGQDGLDLVRSGSYDLVLIDVMMPGMDGYHLASQINEELGDLAPRIVIVTARDVKQEKHIADMTGAVGTLQKPLTIQDLRDKISAILG